MSDQVTAPFGVRLREAMDRFGPLCVGIDPHRGLVEGWGLAYDLTGLGEFADRCVEALAGHVAAVKPQSAFFEVFGSAGIAVLERTILAFRGTGTQVILDAKRGDIGSTMDAYAAGLLGKDAVAAADALTVSPYLGYGSLRPAIDVAEQTGRGVFVLCLTSNAEGAVVQHARAEADGTVAASILAGAGADNADAAARGELGSVGLVIGATVGPAVHDLGMVEALAASAAPVLAPGLGAQGATAEDLRTVFGRALPNVLPSASRSVLAYGPDPAALRTAAVAEAGSLAAAR